MKLLFVHDHVFEVSGSEVRSQQFSYDILRRYLEIFSSITFVGRCAKRTGLAGLPAASGPGVDFVFLESIASLRSHIGLRQRQARILDNLIHCHDGMIARLPSEYGLMAAREARRIGSAYSLEVVGCAWDALWNYGGLKAKLYAPWIFRKMRAEVGEAQRILYVTNSFLQRRYPPKECARVYSVSNVSLACSNESVLTRRLERIGCSKAVIKIGTIASLKTRYKGIQTAIAALALLGATEIDFEYHVLGAGDPSEYMLQAERLGIRSKVFFDGVLPAGRDVLGWLDDIDVYVQPSLTEGLPRALIEAQSRGCPALGSAVGGIPELLVPEMLFEAGNAEALSKRLAELLSNERILVREAERNVCVAKNFDSDLLSLRRREFLLALASATTNGPKLARIRHL
jgi:glycosyltransferase involved in cell wall biosynthesis